MSFILSRSDEDWPECRKYFYKKRSRSDRLADIGTRNMIFVVRIVYLEHHQKRSRIIL
ncbi:MAG: hypothetical protein AB4290_26625 [Spirulina sp.]